ncbi:diguanylate cyclase [Marinimicrobium alkaliphilum]|uniref:diguanylate cyclase n=1 Tax=Marinimicrobium alkaliphilum TaxID=2202654 RepID=UPI000DBAC357|nr:diguanylate cyclase [Marinimicrobium alkaliphilum]
MAKHGFPKRRQPFYRWLLTLLAVWAATGYASDWPIIDITDLSIAPVRAPAEFLARAEPATFDEVRRQDFAPLRPRDINQGISDGHYWIKARLVNDSTQPRTWFIHNETSYIDNLVVYARDNDQSDFSHTHLSDRQPFHQRPVDYRNLTYRHTTPARGHTDVYLNVYFDQADSISLNFMLADEDAFHQRVREENLFYGAYYGILGLLVLLALIVYCLLRQSSALYYALFLFSTGMLWLLLNGFGFQYLWPNSVALHNEGFHIAFLLFAIAGLQFSKSFLKTERHFPRTHRAFTVLQCIALAGIGLRLLGNYGIVLHLAFGMLALLAVAIPAISWMAWRRGLQYARWYLFAWLIYSISLLVAITSAYLGWFTWGMASLNYLQIGSLLEALCLTVAMTERLMSLETDRRDAIALAHQDPLTGLGNRRLLQKHYESMRTRFAQEGIPVFLIMIDLDYFKQVNDTYGHEAGDNVLQEMAKLLRQHSRSDDVCIRYGGEEFAMLLRANTLADAEHIAERVREQFADNATHFQGQIIHHTLSAGITEVLSDQETLSVRDMMARADAALYQGKTTGRNRTVIYRAEDPSSLESGDGGDARQKKC